MDQRRGCDAEPVAVIAIKMGAELFCAHFYRRIIQSTVCTVNNFQCFIVRT
jgi:hypothetical protein